MKRRKHRTYLNNKGRINFRSKKLIILLFVLLVVYLGGHYVYYGSLTRNCIYTEKELPVPEQLAKGAIVVAKDAYVAIGQDGEYSCLPRMGSIDREVVEPAEINKGLKSYYTNRGLRVEPLKKGTSFQAIGVMAVHKYGLTTLDSGGGPIYWVILKDENNLIYQVASFGLNKDEPFLAFYESSAPLTTQAVKLLSEDSFD